MDKQSVPKSISSKSEVRDYLFKALKRDLVGPSWKEGTTEENPVEVLDLQRTLHTLTTFVATFHPLKLKNQKQLMMKSKTKMLIC